ncbi:lipopolysaccharide biosynthesis protein [Calidifontibacter indicus]|uniref:lipopolysaccharide biosynthesis protein n=1 Tax=Calidifontibacter indicus TaxID=419650 RepID=UPI003D7166F8
MSAENDPGPDQMPSAGAAGQLGRRELQDRAIRGASWTMLHTITAVPMGFVVNLILARALGVVHYGRLAFLMTLMDVVGGIIAVGVTTGTLQFGAKAHAVGRTAEVQRLLSQAQGFRLLVAAPLLTIVVVLIADVPPPMLIIAIVFGVWVPGFLDGASTCMAIENKTAAGAKNAMVVNLLTQVSVLLALWLVGTADAVWAARLAAGGLGVGLALLVIEPTYRRAVLSPRLPVAMPPGFWKFALPTTAGWLVGTLVVSRTEVFFLNWLGDGAAVGVFALACGLAAHIFAPAQALVGPLIPAISGLREVDTDSVGPAFERALRATALLVSILFVLAVPAFALLVPTFYGSEYAAAEPMFFALSASGAFLVVGAPVSAFVMGRLAGRTFMNVNLVALVIDVTVAVALIPPYGGWGAVVANIAGALTQLLLLLSSEMRALDLSWSALVKHVRCLPLAVAIATFCWQVAGRFDLGRPLLACGAAGFGATAYLVALRVAGGGLGHQDAEAIARVVPARAERAVRRGLALVTSHA